LTITSYILKRQFYGVETVFCDNNRIKNIQIPTTLQMIRCDLGAIKDLHQHKNKTVKILIMV